MSTTEACTHVDAKLDAILESGVDYITATHLGVDADSGLASFGRHLLREQVQFGERDRDFRFSGYRGRIAGQASYGVRYDSQIVRLSGECARQNWSQVAQLASNVTRLDVQITVLVHDGPTRRLLKHHRQVRRKKNSHGRPARFKFWYGPDGPEACTLGSRQSDWFGRIYNKHLESGFKEYEGTLRYELELKRTVALSTIALLDQDGDEATKIARLVSDFVAHRGLRAPVVGELLEATSGDSCLRSVRASSVSIADRVLSLAASDPSVLLDSKTQRRRAQWLSNCVRPSVQRLIEMGHVDVVLNSLNLLVQDQRLVVGPSRTWSEFSKWR